MTSCALTVVRVTSRAGRLSDNTSGGCADMKGMSMLPLLMVLGIGLAACAADAALILRHPVRLPRPADCRTVTEIRVLGIADGVVVVTTTSRPSGCREA